MTSFRNRVILASVLILNHTVATPRARAQLDPKVWTPEAMMSFQRVSGVQVSPDGKQVVFVARRAVLEGDRSEYLSHLYLGNAQGGGSRQLTQGDKSCDDPQWSPDGQWIGFLSRRSGVRNLWVIRPNGGEADQVTDLATDVTSFKWAPDGRAVAFTAKDAPTAAEKQASRRKDDARVVDEDIKMSRLHVVPFSSPIRKRSDSRMLTKGSSSVSGGGRGGYDWSPDGKSIAFSHTRTPHADDWSSADLSVVEVATGTVRSLARTAAAETSPHYSPDGKSIAFVASDDPPTWAGTARIHVVASGGGRPTALADTHDAFGRYSELLGWAADGKRLYFTEVHGTRFRVVALPLDGPPVVLSTGEGMSTGATLSPDRRTLGYSWESSHEPPEAFVSPVDRWSPVRVSEVHAKSPKLPAGVTEVIRWKSKDGLEIEGLLTHPAGQAKGKRAPLLVVIHGGPMGVFTQGFDGAAGLYPIATFAAHGYAVLRPNPRGSSGYGKKFRYANYGDWGGGDFRDIMAGVDHLIDRGIADADRLGVMGWSYGGFMTSWTITQTQRFKAASVGAGVTNLVSFTGTADIPSFLPDYFGGEFWTNLDAYRNHSAMFHVKGVKTPTLIQHGERDERVPLSQGQELYNALKRQGCPVKMVIYPRTPHGIEEPRLLLDCMNRNLAWFEQHIGDRVRPVSVETADTTSPGLIPAGAKLEKVAGDCKFTEGPAGDADGNLFFTDSPNLRIMVVRPGGKVEVWTDKSQSANGMRFDAKGRLHACCSQLGARAVVRYDRSGKVTIIADRYEGKRFNAPNDLCFDPQGRIYFTDPCYGKKPSDGVEKFAVYRIEAKDGEPIVNQVTRVIDDVAMPNGIAISLDAKTLYVAESVPGPEGLHRLLAYDIRADGTCKRRAVLHDFGPRRGIDGMVLDTKGNIYATAETGEKSGVYIFSPEGKQLGFLHTPEHATNCVFGDADLQTLYITAGRSLYKIRTNAVGFLVYPKPR